MKPSLLIHKEKRIISTSNRKPTTNDLDVAINVSLKLMERETIGAIGRVNFNGFSAVFDQSSHMSASSISIIPRFPFQSKWNMKVASR